jgi:hypothetical protein
MLPEEIPIVHVPGHQKGRNLEATGNSMAGEAAMEAACKWRYLSLT